MSHEMFLRRKCAVVENVVLHSSAVVGGGIYLIGGQLEIVMLFIS